MSPQINEDEAELLIEEHLRERGWNLTDFTVTRKRWREYLDGEEADRVFFHDGRLVAILEAKKPGKDLWAALDQAYYTALAGKLEYADLRDLQEAILSKASWPLFAEHFVNKETLAKRFDQLVELRNGIRHCRTVDEVTRKEGEAAVIWFRQMLAR